MKRVNNQHKHGFTIIELLTVMSIIVILISMLTPALNRVRRYSTDVKQRAQFHSIAMALDMFNADNDGYPDSNAEGPNFYGGAMRLAEALVGQDLKGFNPTSRFEQRGFIGTITTVAWTDATGYVMPYPPKDYPTPQLYSESMRTRKMYLELERANAYMLRDIYDLASIPAGFDPNTYVLCDSYNRVVNKRTNKRIGMPILYYKADSSKSIFPDTTIPATTMAQPNTRITYTYNYYDNQQIIDFGIPWMPNLVHPLASNSALTTPDGVTIADNPKKFYDTIRNSRVSSNDTSYKPDSYILISAGYDGLYGTKDDIYNFID